MHKLTYLSLPGHAFVSRSCFRIGGIEFEDEIVEFPDFAAAKAATPAKFPLGQMPILTLPSGQVIAQSGAQARYAGRLANLYPTDPEEQLRCDEIFESCFEFMNLCPHQQFKDADEKKRCREEFAANVVPVYFGFFANKLAAGGGGYFVGGRLTIADLFFYSAVKCVRSGFWDYVPPSIDVRWPAIGAFIDTMESNPVFAPHKL